MPFVLMFCGLWEDDCGVVHRNPPRRGGDASAPLSASTQFWWLCRPGWRVWLIWMTCTSSPKNLSTSETDTRWEKTKLWNRAGVRPQVCDILKQMARESDPCTGVERIRQAREPVGKSAWHTFWSPSVCPRAIGDHCSRTSAVLLLLHCGSARANCFLRVVR